MKIEQYPLIKSALSQSPAGESLRNTYRWSQFRTTETNEEWLKIFGATGQVLSHSDLFYHLSEWMINKEKGLFTPQKKETFLYGIAVHDVGEAKLNGQGVGDIGAYMKNESHEKRESIMAGRVIKSLDLPKDLKKKLQESYEMVIEAKDPDLNFAFKALEKSEYVFTAMKAYQNSLKLNSQGKPGLALITPMVARVLVIDLGKAIDKYLPYFPKSLGALFKSAIPLVDEMFEYSLPWLNNHDEWLGKPVNHKAMAKDFKIKWENFKKG